MLAEYRIMHNEGYWELYDGTKIDNGSFFPLLSHENKERLIKKSISFIGNPFKLDIYDKFGKWQETITGKNVD
jgi:hypothetical protein